MFDLVVLYLCTYISVEGRQFSAVAQAISDAKLVAQENCAKSSPLLHSCEFVGCKEVKAG